MEEKAAVNTIKVILSHSGYNAAVKQVSLKAPRLLLR